MNQQELQQLFESSTDEKVYKKLELAKFNPEYVRWLENIIINNPALDPNALEYDQIKSQEDNFYKPYYLREDKPIGNSLNRSLLIQMKNNPEVIKLENSDGDVISLRNNCGGWTCKINKGNEFFISTFWGHYPGRINVSGEGTI